MHQIHTKIDKKTKKFRFLTIIFNFCTFFQKLGGLESHRRSTKKQFVSGGFFEVVKAICSGKMHQIQTEIDKITKKFKFLKILCNFFVLFEKFRGLEN